MINWISHCWIVIQRLVIRRFGVGSRIAGNAMASIIVPTGTSKKADSSSFTSFFKGKHMTSWTVL